MDPMFDADRKEVAPDAYGYWFVSCTLLCAAQGYIMVIAGIVSCARHAGIACLTTLRLHQAHMAYHLH